MIKRDGFILIWMEDLSVKNKIAVSDVYSVCNLNLQVNSSEFVCISGLYGTDKISFINTLSCLNRPDQGKYLYNYSDTATIDKTILDSLRSEIGFIFKNLNMNNDLTVYQNIELPISISSLVEKSIAVTKVSEKLILSDILHSKIKMLSDLEKHKISLARALAVRPLLIIADEPTDGLAYEEAEVFLNTLKEINNENTAIICFSEKNLIIEKVQRHIVFEKGVIKSDSRVKNYSKEEGVI